MHTREAPHKNRNHNAGANGQYYRLVLSFPGLLLLIMYQAEAATPHIEHWQSRQGAEVFFVATHQLPIVDVQLMFDAGSARDPANRKGLAVLTASLLDEGAGGMDADEIGYEFERLGAIFSAGAGYDSTTATLRSLSDDAILTPALQNFNRVISAPDFPDQAVQRQRNRMLSGLQRKQQSPGALAGDAFYAAIYQQHPYASPGAGTVESVNAIDRADILDFYRNYYTASNATIAIVGDLDRKGAEKIAEDLISTLTKGIKPEPLPEVQSAAAGAEINIDFPSMQTHIMLGQPGLKWNDTDYFPLYVGNHILGGSGMVSRVYEQIREQRGLAYSVYTYFSPRREAGPFTAGLQTRADQADAALQLLKENISAFIETGPTVDELEAAGENITGGFALRIDSNSEILGYVGVIGFYQLPLDYMEVFTERVNAVTVGQIKDAFQRRLSPDKMATVMVGPAVNNTSE
jgi:zinc protease